MAVVRPAPDLDSLRTLLNPAPSPTRVYMSGTPAAPEGTEDEDAPVLEFTARGRVEVITLESVGVTLVDIQDDPESLLDEVTRETETVRITNPEDPEDYVDQDVATTLTVRNVRGATRRYLFTL